MHSARTYLSVVKSISHRTLSPLLHSSIAKMSNSSNGQEGRASIPSSHIDDIYEVPIAVIKRPIPPVLDEAKVASLMETYKNNPSQIPPIDVMWIVGREGGNYYYSFGGCHRFESAVRLGLDKIKCKLFKSNVDDLRFYMGSSTPDLK